ncbi:MAG: hypothetical protein A2008_13715 [Candidatus Wallbacteria bacterium GWC2_49_35]|uniref:DUF6754 domain-containing protein n=1 Tax=Candidatus Wallbacteria bacterium GWC2_49_35 TaxID=1817813 RepID=A0A1F7WWV8_9BACT|nr:MAG: hypothetical protein A2008_13715 [Candidatus Wallbacteria bacterium GWC2_49_35]HBC74264.1 hypothetical protein [Candidatus Wallbacteria bacterium]
MNALPAPLYPGFYSDSRETVLIIFALFSFIILASMLASRFGFRAKVRRIGAIGAIEEAIGRAAETGRPVLYLSGMYDMNSIATMASINILSHVAETAARYEVDLKMACCRSLVMNAARDAVSAAYSAAGKPELYRPDNISYITDDQWGFACAVDSIITRERPAANLMFGHFVSESLIYAETGFAVGAMQIAATNDFNQIPFFVIACDYCMIGEELYAAAAYLSKKPHAAAHLLAIDICKSIIILMIIYGVISVSFFG